MTKKHGFWRTAAMAAALVCALVLAGCPSPSGPDEPPRTKFEGTWAANGMGGLVGYAFAGNKYIQFNTAASQTSTGTFTFTGTTITWIPSSGASWTHEYMVDSNYLDLTRPAGDTHYAGTFEKRYSSTPGLGCPYSAVATNTYPTFHYLLTISFEQARTIIQGTLGNSGISPEILMFQTGTSLSAASDYVIFEETPVDFRLIQQVNGTIVKRHAWNRW